jgi:hypothetical protein
MCTHYESHDHEDDETYLLSCSRLVMLKLL